MTISIVHTTDSSTGRNNSQWTMLVFDRLRSRNIKIPIEYQRLNDANDLNCDDNNDDDHMDDNINVSNDSSNYNIFLTNEISTKRTLQGGGDDVRSNASTEESIANYSIKVPRNVCAANDKQLYTNSYTIDRRVQLFGKQQEQQKQQRLRFLLFPRLCTPTISPYGILSTVIDTRSDSTDPRHDTDSRNNDTTLCGKGKVSTAIRSPRSVIVIDNDTVSPTGYCATNTAETVLIQRTTTTNKTRQNRSQPMLWKYASNHVMVNQERERQMIAPLRRLHELDAIARYLADEMALFESLQYVPSEQLLTTIIANTDGKLYNFTIAAQNICKGSSIRDMHTAMISNQQLLEYTNIVDPTFQYMGMATSSSSSIYKKSYHHHHHQEQFNDILEPVVVQQRPILYLCQIFVG